MKTGKLPNIKDVKLPKNWGKVKGTTAFDPPVKPVKKLPVEKWKPEDGNRVYYIDMISLAVEVFKYDGSIKSWLSSNLHRIFRTRALAEKALKKIKHVLKECKHG